VNDVPTAHNLLERILHQFFSNRPRASQQQRQARQTGSLLVEQTRLSQPSRAALFCPLVDEPVIHHQQ
jgi:hypothetical protein